MDDAFRDRESLISPGPVTSSSDSDESSATVASSNGWTAVATPGTAPAVGQTYT